MRNLFVEARWPLDPIVALVRSQINKESPTNKDISRATGVSERRVRNARECGFITDDYIADKMAQRLRKHPTSVWPEFYENANTWFAADIQENLVDPVTLWGIVLVSAVAEARAVSEALTVCYA